MKVLVIDDNIQVISDVTFCLQVRYPEVVVASASAGLEAIQAVEIESPDLVMASSSLPDIDIVDLICRIREFSDVPLIVLSKGESDMERARGLEMGADEYVAEPFSPIELLARVRPLFRRTHLVGFKLEGSVSFGDELTIDFSTHEVRVLGRLVKLTPIEYELLSELVRNSGRVLTHHRLLEKVWGSEYTDERSFVKKYIYRLRRKLENDARKPQLLLNERGVGYRFAKPT